MIEDYISDPNLRRQAEQMLENWAQAQGRFSNGMIVDSVRGDTFRTVPGRRAAVRRAIARGPPASAPRVVRPAPPPAARTEGLARAHATGSNCGNQIRSVTP